MSVAVHLLEEERPTREEALGLTPFQALVMAVPEAYDVALTGGRGGGKTYGLLALGLRHAAQHGRAARVLLVRRTYPALRDAEQTARELFGRVHGAAASYNSSSHVWTLPGGGLLELGQLDAQDDLQKYQGRSTTLLLVDELTQWPDPGLVDTLRGGLRAPRGIPVRAVYAMNPGGAGHGWAARRYVNRGADWRPVLEPDSGRLPVRAPSTLADNPHLDRAGYEQNLAAATAHDPGLAAAWIDGDWAAARAGSFFGAVLGDRAVLDPWPTPAESPWWRPAPEARWGVFAAFDERRRAHALGNSTGWRLYVAYDHGSSAPAACYLLAESPGGLGPDERWYPRGSLVAVDEVASAAPGRPNTGLGWTVERTAQENLAMCERWHAAPRGVADPSLFAQHGSGHGSLAEQFLEAGVDFDPAPQLPRVTGWAKLKQMLKNASDGAPDLPGMYLTRRCIYALETLGTLPRDPRRPEDLDSTAADHGADALRYGALAGAPGAAVGFGRVTFG
ncbi:MAG TPA: terminase family protein [Thermoanaerobaculia bacterium]|nr:terminase family protein [Thermoanaerobaculia bacterium]